MGLETLEQICVGLEPIAGPICGEVASREFVAVSAINLPGPATVIFPPVNSATSGVTATQTISTAGISCSSTQSSSITSSTQPSSITSSPTSTLSSQSAIPTSGNCPIPNDYTCNGNVFTTDYSEWTDDNWQCDICSNYFRTSANDCYFEVNCTAVVAIAENKFIYAAGSAGPVDYTFEDEIIAACGSAQTAILPIDPWLSNCCYRGAGNPPGSLSVYCLPGLPI